MYYVCVEDNIVVSILDYPPTVPSSVEVIEITDAEYKKLDDQTHYFDIEKKSVFQYSEHDITDQQEKMQDIIHRDFLSKTDWKVLRHLRETALGIPTSLSSEEYLDLERQRQEAAKNIVDNK